MSWSKEENGRFELAVAEYGTDNPAVWPLVAQAVGGGKTADDAWQHFLELDWDVNGMGANERTARRRQRYQQLHQHGADDDDNTTAAPNNSRRNRNHRHSTSRRRSNGGAGEGSSRNSRANNNGANRPQA